MAQRKRQTLKGYFEVGDIPTQQNYHDWIESNVLLSDVNSGSILLTGSISLNGTNGSITASQNISSSGTIYAARFEPNIITSGIISSSAITGTSSFGTEIVLDYNTQLQSKDGGTNVLNLAYLSNANNFIFAANTYPTKLLGTSITLDSVTDITLDAAGDDVYFADNGTTTVWINTNKGHITASGDISASGTIYANDFKSSGGDVSGVNFHDNLNITGSITASGDISSSGTIYAQSFGGDISATSITLNGKPVGTSTDTFWSSGSAGKIYYNGGNVGIGTSTPGSTLEVIGHISASGTLSASAIYADTIYTSGSTLFVGSEAFSQAHLSDLKQGKTIISDDRKKTVAAVGDSERVSDSSNYIRPEIIFHPTDDESAIIHKTAGRWFFRSPGGDPFEVYADGEEHDYIKLGSTTTKATQVRIPGAISASKTNAEHVIGGNTTFKGTAVVSGSLTITGSSTLTNWGNFRNRMHKDHHAFEVSTNPYVVGGFKYGHTPIKHIGNEPHLHFILSGSGQAGVGTLSPQHTLHVSESSANFKALQVEGQSQFNGFVGTMGVGNATTITSNTSVPSGYNVILWTSNANPSITVQAGTNYTVNTGADVIIKNMNNI